MKIAILSYDYSGNLGDEIQSIAMRNLLPHVDGVIGRENLANFKSKDKHLLLINGWFSHNPENQFPPSSDIIPLYYSFHITPTKADFFTSPKCIAHFKKHQPIGCRDRGTTELLQASGVEAFYSKCVTLTFARREKQPKNGKIFLVDVDGLSLPKRIKENAVCITHGHNSHHLDNEWKTTRAQTLLDRYKNEASLIITNRVHCALPCLAMGIPTVYLKIPANQLEYRASIVAELGCTVYRRAPLAEFFRCIRQSRYSRLIRQFRNCRLADFKPLHENQFHVKTLDMSVDADRIRRELNQRINQYLTA